MQRRFGLTCGRLKNISPRREKIQRPFPRVDYLRTERNNDEDATLAARAAWLYFAGGKTQGEVADLLNVPNTRAHRLIARASREGLIKVFVDGPIAGCVGP